VVAIMQLADAVGCTELKEECLSFTVKRIEAVSQTTDFSRMVAGAVLHNSNGNGGGGGNSSFFASNAQRLSREFFTYLANHSPVSQETASSSTVSSRKRKRLRHDATLSSTSALSSVSSTSLLNTSNLNNLNLNTGLSSSAACLPPAATPLLRLDTLTHAHHGVHPSVSNTSSSSSLLNNNNLNQSPQAHPHSHASLGAANATLAIDAEESEMLSDPEEENLLD